MLPEEGITVAVSVMPNANVKPQSYLIQPEAKYSTWPNSNLRPQLLVCLLCSWVVYVFVYIFMSCT